MSRTRTAFRTLVLVLFAALLLGSVGCEAIARKASEKVVENATGTKIDQDGDQVTIKGEDGREVTASSSDEGIEMPKDFPEDVPVYEGKITASLKANEGSTLGIETADSVADVYDWYVGKVKDEGWKSTGEFKTEDGGMIAAEKDGRQLSVTISADSDEKTAIIITVADKN